MATRTDDLLKRNSGALAAREWTRGEFFGGLFALGCVNGLTSRVIQSIDRTGWANALFNTFEISIIIWVSCIAGIVLVLRDRTHGVKAPELCLALGFLFLVILPIGPLSWVAVSALSLYILVTTHDLSSRSGAIILLATTVPMLWSRLLFQFFAPLILEIDASLVAWILGTHRTETIVEFADGSGQLVIFPGCSSLANVSLAFLCWVTISQLVRHKESIYDLFWCLLACVSVIAVNVTRISIQGLSQWHYNAFHSLSGDLITNTIILTLIVGFCALGVRRELFAHA
jgi:hypothetical protein